MAAAWRVDPFWALFSACGAEIAILLPSTLLVVAASLSWNHFRHTSWRLAFERAMGPLTLGVLFAVGVKTPRLSPLDVGGGGTAGGFGVIHR
jgi:chromate transporter